MKTDAKQYNWFIVLIQLVFAPIKRNQYYLCNIGEKQIKL